MFRFYFFGGKNLIMKFENIFLHDKGNNLKGLSSNIPNVTTETTILAKSGIIEKKNVFI